jgi:hypothetical protein
LITRAIAAVLVCVSVATAAFAQEPSGAMRRAAVDTVIGWQDYSPDTPNWPAQYVIDMFSSAAIARGWQVAFRPKLWRTRGEWDGLLDQLSVQREFRRGSNWRVEFGRFPSPIGLGMTENRADVNPGMLWWHRPYYMPLPSLGADVPKVSLVSAVYPEGVIVSASRTHWDARVGLVDRAPVQFWSEDGALRRPNGVLGGGVTPRAGLRLGVATAWGAYAEATAASPPSGYLMVNVEGEYAIGYLKVSGEWTRDRFQTATGDRVSQGLTLQAQQTLTPRFFAHIRASDLQSPDVTRSTPEAAVFKRYRSIDSTLGYRLSTAITVRLGHSAVQTWTGGPYDQQVGASLMWATRWW